MSSNLNRRQILKQVITGSAALATGVVVPSNLIASVKQGFQNDTEPFSLKGKIKEKIK